MGLTNHQSRCARVSVLVLTKNEQVNIAACLASLSFSDDIVVLDSCSTDQTVQIAESFDNVRVVQRPFDTWSKHSNWALDNIDFKHPWVYYSDADEIVTPQLRDEIIAKVNDPDQQHAAFRLRYRNMFRGRWLRHGGIYPVWILRLYRPEKVRYEDREVNAHPVVDGSTGELQEHFIHQSFNKGLIPWLTKHNSYSEMESHEALRVRKLPLRGLLRDLWEGDRAVRRRAVKNLSFRLPGRAMVRFVYMYLLRWGVFDGGAGFHYAAMISMYEYWITLKMRERGRDWHCDTQQIADKLLSSNNDTAGEPGPIDVIIPTFNEADHIVAAVKNAKQKNWGLDHLPLTGKWVFILDADERLTPDLRDEIMALVAEDAPYDGLVINRMMLFMGRRILHGGLYPSWNLRLFKRGKARYEQRSVHEHMVCDGPVKSLRHPMLHIRRETISQYIAKHIRYADLESDEWIKRKLGRSEGAQPHRLFSRMLGHRQWLRRHIWPHLPWRPLWRFLYMYIVRLGILDGRAGWDMACLMASYEYIISLLYHEKMNRLESKPPRRREHQEENMY
jgi:glycosyltransferase involved in cell wall biosynthesis